MNLTNRDGVKIRYLLSLADEHRPGGKYSMVAAWLKGKRFIVGYNDSDRPAATAVDNYPDICGIHAELDVMLRAKATNTDVRGGTMYIVGKKQSNGKIMSNTRPCIYCRAILSSTKVRNVIFFNNGTLHKLSSEELW